MSACCTVKQTNTSAPKDAVCPENGKRCKPVKRKTLLHQLTQPWNRTIPEQTYYYCDDSQCEVVYFGEDKTIFTSGDMRLDKLTRSYTVCYCFDVSIDDLKNNKEQCKEFVVEQTRKSTCDCEIRNPSGKCCLKDFH